MNITHHPPQMTAEEAERLTGLDAREVSRPATESDCGFEVTPKARFQFLRYQLGKDRSEFRQYRREPKMLEDFAENVRVFELVAFGRTWEDAVERAMMRGYGEVRRPASEALPVPISETEESELQEAAQ